MSWHRVKKQTHRHMYPNISSLLCWSQWSKRPQKSTTQTEFPQTQLNDLTCKAQRSSIIQWHHDWPFYTWRRYCVKSHVTVPLCCIRLLHTSDKHSQQPPAARTSCFRARRPGAWRVLVVSQRAATGQAPVDDIRWRQPEVLQWAVLQSVSPWAVQKTEGNVIFNMESNAKSMQRYTIPRHQKRCMQSTNTCT